MAKSVQGQFLKQLTLATATFVVVLSFIFYGYIKSTIHDEIKNNLIKDAQLINKISSSSETKNIPFNVISKSGVSIDLIISNRPRDIFFNVYEQEESYYAQLIYPFEDNSAQFIKIVKNIDETERLFNKIFRNLLVMSLGGLVMVVLYSLTISKILVGPILRISRNLSNMNERSLGKINVQSLPEEFHPLASSINQLSNRIEGYVKYQKELFIGAAHELKTPLAVMKLKNEITLRKPREIEKYEEVLKLNIEEIDGMNKMITSILDIGRQEGAQFEKAQEIDIIDYLKNKMQGYKLIADRDDVKLNFTSNISSYIILIQPTLLNQIIQNFVQNAIKFTPTNKSVSITTFFTDEWIEINVIDEGIGIDEAIDLFAPFIRVGEAQGAGLGLFLAKSAADALGADISLRNRTDEKQGTVATLRLYINPYCKI
jgi:two-component system OmpR family sensor kinase